MQAKRIFAHQMAEELTDQEIDRVCGAATWIGTLSYSNNIAHCPDDAKQGTKYP